MLNILSLDNKFDNQI